MTDTTTSVPVRDASTVILVRDPARKPSILMGQRGRNAAFMPDKMVFPGGAVDAEDGDIELTNGVPDCCAGRLKQQTEAHIDSLCVAAVREVFEETGLILGQKGLWQDAPSDWTNFANQGYRPDASALRFFFRAITPPGRPRRFDARFFLADARALEGNIDDFSGASAELSHLQWVPIEDMRALNLAFITRLVLAELRKHLPSLDAPEAVPLVKNDVLDRGVTWLS